VTLFVGEEISPAGWRITPALNPKERRGLSVLLATRLVDQHTRARKGLEWLGPPERNTLLHCEMYYLLSAFRDRGVPKPMSECRRVPQPRWVDARPSAKGGSEVAGDGRERGGNPAAFVFVPRPGRVRLQ
jgi:hypothetical protein